MNSLSSMIFTQLECDSGGFFCCETISCKSSLVYIDMAIETSREPKKKILFDGRQISANAIRLLIMLSMVVMLIVIDGLALLIAGRRLLNNTPNFSH
jgi:hypothetical protein